MSLALYRKYRPQKFSEVSGQQHIRVTIEHEIEKNQIAHAYLFSGPRGTGKTTMARLLAKALNCEKRKEGTSEPCQKCESCEEIAKNASLDVQEIDAASHTGVDNIRENIIHSARLSPSKRKYKVYIIDEVHMLSISAFNALLKTLEEPPSHVVFVLATTEIHKVPQTIVSRCQRFDFRKVGAEDLVARLKQMVKSEKRHVDDSVLSLIVRRSDGSFRDAESMLGQILSLETDPITLDQAKLVIPFSDIEKVLDFISCIKDRNLTKAIDSINDLVSDGVDLERFLDECIEAFRHILLITMQQDRAQSLPAMIESSAERVRTLSEGFSLERIVFCIETLVSAKEGFFQYPVMQLPLEIAAVKMCAGKKNESEENPPDSHRAETERKKSSLPSEGREIGPAEKDRTKESGSNNILHISFETIKEHWGTVLDRVKEYNHALFSFLCVNKPLSVTANKLQIGVIYDFHRQRINEMKNKLAIEQILQDILGAEMFIECVSIKNENLPGHLQKDDVDAESIAQEFGGSVVD